MTIAITPKSILTVIASFLLILGVYFYTGNGKRNNAAETKRSDDPVTAIYEKCKAESKETCYAKEFKELSKQQGHEIAFKTLYALQKVDPDAQGCHLISHGIGSGAYERDPSSWKTLIRTLDPSCSYGAPHGVLERYVATIPEKQLTSEMIPTICGENPRADCNHIIGHLLLVQTKAAIDPAIELCKVFEKDRTQYLHCLTGVFMEYQTALNLIDHGLAPKSWLNWPERVDELEAVCRKYSNEPGIACWKEIIHAALVKFKDDPKTIFDFCSSSQITEGAYECRRHAIGVMAAGKRFDLDVLKYMCDLPQPNDPTFKSDCYVQLVASTISTIPTMVDKVKQFCSSLGETYQQPCLNYVNSNTRQPTNL